MTRKCENCKFFKTISKTKFKVKFEYSRKIMDSKNKSSYKKRHICQLPKKEGLADIFIPDFFDNSDGCVFYHMKDPKTIQFFRKKLGKKVYV